MRKPPDEQPKQYIGMGRDWQGTGRPSRCADTRLALLINMRGQASWADRHHGQALMIRKGLARDRRGPHDTEGTGKGPPRPHQLLPPSGKPVMHHKLKLASD